MLVAQVALYNCGKGCRTSSSIKLDGSTSFTISNDLTPAGGGYRIVLAYLPNAFRPGPTPSPSPRTATCSTRR